MHDTIKFFLSTMIQLNNIDISTKLDKNCLFDFSNPGKIKIGLSLDILELRPDELGQISIFYLLNILVSRT